MKNLIRQSQPDDVKIEEIIDSFGRFAIGDIKHNIDKPIAAFILCSCLIDQLAAFTYNHGIRENAKHYKKFIKDYLPSYNPLKLYNDLRCLLVHNYSISEYLAISSNHPLIDADTDNISINHITAKGLLKDLEIAFETLTKELRNNTPVRNNALNRYTTSPPLIAVDKRFWKYSEIEADYLINYYYKKAIGKPMNANSDFKITSIIKTKIDDSKEPFIVRCVAKKEGRDYVAHLDIITQQLKLTYPIDALKGANLSQ